jgi:hypothetical protein
MDDCLNDFENLLRNGGQVEDRHGEAIFAGGGSTLWYEEEMTCIASNAESGERT